MTDINNLPETLRNDLLAIVTQKYGQDAGKRDCTTPEGSVRSLPVTEFRISRAHHVSLPDSYFLDVRFDEKTNDFVFQLIENPDCVPNVAVE